MIDYDYFFDKAQRQYENQMPERDKMEPLFECDCCGDGIFCGEGYFCINETCYCEKCVSHYIAEKGDE